MKLRNLGLTLILAALIMVAYIPPAAAGILKSASQMVNLVGSSDNTGIIPLSSFQRVMPDGSTAPFIIPGNRVLLITKIMFYIASAQTVPNAQFRMEPFYNKNVAISNGFGSQNVDIESGFPIAVWSNSFNVRVINRADSQTVPGTLKCRIIGLLAPPEAIIVPINLLLLLE
jgi:hypothetical protein